MHPQTSQLDSDLKNELKKSLLHLKTLLQEL